MVRTKNSRKKEETHPKHGAPVVHSVKHSAPKVVSPHQKKKHTKPAVHSVQSHERHLESERDIAMDFATAVHKKFGNMIKAVVLFGSQVKHTAKTGSDIDVVIVIDDASINWDTELTAWYREELGKILSTQQHSREFHVNTIRLTTWWHDMLHGDPVIVNILRYGEALIDSGGFFNPLKALLVDGQIKSTPEAVHAALQRAPFHLTRSKLAQVGAIEGTYWCMVDSAQAALMTAGKIPPSPEHIPQLLKTTFVDKGLLKLSAVKAFDDLYVLHKSIAHNTIMNIKGEDVDAWQDTAEKFMGEMVGIVKQLLEEKKE